MKEVGNVIPPHLREGFRQDVKPKNVMGKNEFLKLLVTQLRHQDPLKPMEHNEFIAQLAQFSSLEQLSNIDNNIKHLHKGAGEEAKVQALGMIGKGVEATGDVLDLTEGQQLSFRHSLSADSKPVRATIYSTNGKLVRTLDLSQRPDSVGREVAWDGKDENGDLLPSGKYTFRVLGLNSDGRAEEVGAEISGRVTGVRMEGQTPILEVETAAGIKTIELGSIRKVTLNTTSQRSGASRAADVAGLAGADKIDRPNVEKMVHAAIDNKEDDWDSEPRGFRGFEMDNPIRSVRR